MDGYSGKLIDELRESMIIDASFRITALENILIKKNIITEEEIQEELKRISDMVSKTIADESELDKSLQIFNLDKRKISKNN